MVISHLDNLASEAQRVKKHHDFLKSLRFREIKQRHSAIQDHHKATFNWVFTEGETGFREWLEEGSGFFWVKGKTGSGKSTLMKFIATHEDTQSLLRTWGGRHRVITASHFFWNAGLSMQKSLTGLFQTILYQVLRECPELIDIIDNSRQDSLADSKLYDSWDDKALFRAFEQISSQESLPLRFCFFIDGLDEYTAGAHRYNGTFEELLSPLRVLASSNSIKICVSSRPWDAFDREFSHVKWKLQLEDLTREDIRRYVKEELGVDPKFQKLSEMDPRRSQIKDTIVERAQGVFLWVYLVVNSLKRGLLKDDNYSDLQSRLNELPDDLQKYFERMLQSIETIYWDSTTRIFRTVIAAEQALPLLAFELLDREMDDPDYALTMQASPLTDVESEAICKRSNTRLNARCGDLLYVTVNPTEIVLFKSQVDFLHRTVRDFFLDTGVLDDMIQKRPTEKFDPHLSLCRIMLGLNKAMDSPRFYNQLYIIADGLMHYARNVEEIFGRLEQDGMSQHDESSLEQVFKILDELDRTNSEVLNHLGVHWTNTKDPPRGTFQEGLKKTFLAATIQARLSLYTADRLRKDSSEIRQKGGRPLLDYALRPAMVTPLQIVNPEQGPVLPVLELLLDMGADPNARIYMYGNRTPWELFLEMCYRHISEVEYVSSDTIPWSTSKHLIHDIGSAMEMMVERGARTDGTFQVTNDTHLKVLEIVDRIVLPRHRKSRIQELVESRQQGRSFLSRVFRWG
jgi:energy-coupling factor transporter ATP-binding protein EcfA2